MDIGFLMKVVGFLMLLMAFLQAFNYASTGNIFYLKWTMVFIGLSSSFFVTYVITTRVLGLW